MRIRWSVVSILLEVVGRGLDCDLGDVLRPYYWQDCSEDLASLKSGAYQHDQLSPSQMSLRVGLIHWREGQLDQACELLSRSCCHEHGNAAARAALACVLIEQGDATSGLEQLRVLNRLRPDEGPIQFAMGYCYERMSHPVSAAVHYRRAVTLDETLELAQLRLAAVGLQAGNLDEAIVQYEHICRTNPEKTWLRTSLANLYYRAGKYEKSVEAFQMIIAMEPENWALEDDRIVKLVAEGNIRAAIQLTHTAIEDQGPFADLYVRLGNLYSMVGDDDPAVKYLLEALEIQPGYIEALVKLASHHLIFGRWEQAAECFGQASAQGEKLLANYIGMGVAQAAAGQQKHAAESFDLAVSVEPECTILHAQMIRLHWKITMADEFLRRVDMQGPKGDKFIMPEDKLQSELQCHAEKVRKNGDFADARFHYGVLLRSVGRFDEALHQFAYAVRYHRTHLPSLSKLGISLHEKSRYKAAANVFLRIMQPTQEEIQFHYKLGVNYTQKGELEKLADEIHAQQPEYPKQADIRQRLALSLETLGLVDRGAKTWRTLSQTHHVEM